jgi:arginine/lysine/histidine/glutamine transport system substrate-binding/permease protein
MASQPSLRWLRRLLILLSAMTLVILLSQAPNRAQTSQTTWQVGTEPTFPPFEMKNEATGALEGFDIDLMQALGAAAGQQVKFISLPFDGLIPALQAKTLDMVISGMTITPERGQTVDFSSPYFKAGLAIAVREGNNQIKSLEDLKGKRIAVQIGTTGAEQANQVEGATVSTFDGAPLALQELLNGRVDAVVNDLPVTLFAINEAKLKGIKVVGGGIGYRRVLRYCPAQGESGPG